MKRKKKFLEVVRMPKTIPTPTMEVPPLYVFKKNKKRNPYSHIIDNFLKRQLIIATHFSLITAVPLRDQLNLFAYIMLIREHKENKLVTPENRIKIDKKNKTIKMKQMQNYLAMSLVAQTFENFEALIKDLYREYLKINIKAAPALDVALSQIPRRNAEVLKTLKTFFPSLTTYLTENRMTWIRVIENVRHSTVHTDQLIAEKIVNGNDNKTYHQNFDFKKVKDAKLRIQIDKTQGLGLIKNFDNIGFNIFNYASLDSGYPVDLKIKSQ